MMFYLVNFHVTIIKNSIYKFTFHSYIFLFVIHCVSNLEVSKACIYSQSYRHDFRYNLLRAVTCLERPILPCRRDGLPGQVLLYIKLRSFKMFYV